ncbi:GNAT family N-acetyltransferase [Cellulomonas sp. NPDC055163]
MTTELRRWDLSDAPALRAALAGSADLAVQLGGGTDLDDLAACERLIVAQLDSWGPSHYAFAISIDGTAVGAVGLSHVEHVHDTAWVSYWLAASHRGHGIATHAVQAVAAWAFGTLGLFRLELGHRVNNPASCHVARRAGFVAEGTERRKLRYGTERFDVETHARLRTDPAPAGPAWPVVGIGEAVTLGGH